MSDTAMIGESRSIEQQIPFFSLPFNELSAASRRGGVANCFVQSAIHRVLGTDSFYASY
jgi:hypothetical protein